MEHGLPYESTGTNALDALIGKGVTVRNCLILFDELETNDFYYCKPIQRCFIAEGLDHGQELFLSDPNPNGANKLLAELPAKLQQKSSDASTKNATDVERESREEEERFRIAWRYQTQPMFDSTLGRNSDKMMADPDHAEAKFDLSRTDAQLDVDHLISTGQITVHDWQDQQPSFEKLWPKIHEKLTSTTGKVLRIVLNNLSSPLFADAHVLPLFLTHLMAFCRRSHGIAILSLDSSLINPAVYQNCLAYADAAFQLQRMDKTEQKALCLRHTIDGGRLHTLKLPSVRSAGPAILPQSFDLLFSLKKRFLEIKLLHLPPAIGDEDGGSARSKKPKTPCQAQMDQF